jgi:hypothetical protein
MKNCVYNAQGQYVCSSAVRESFRERHIIEDNYGQENFTDRSVRDVMTPIAITFDMNKLTPDEAMVELEKIVNRIRGDDWNNELRVITGVRNTPVIKPRVEKWFQDNGIPYSEDVNRGILVVKNNSIPQIPSAAVQGLLAPSVTGMSFSDLQSMMSGSGSMQCSCAAK